MPKVSVIMASWNAEKTIVKTIESILSQSYTDLELIVIDDHSTDGTLSIINNYKDERLLVIERKVNSGSPVAPRNQGFSTAKGTWIALCDNDDLWAKDKLERQLLAYEASEEKEQIGFIYSAANIIDAKGDNIDTNPSLFSGFVPAKLSRKRLLEGYFITTCSIMIKKSVVDEVGPLNEKLVGIDDYEYLLRITKGYGMLAIPERLVSWRRTGANLSGDKAEQYKKDEVIFEKLEKGEPDNQDVLIGHGKNLFRILMSLVIEGRNVEAKSVFEQLNVYPVSYKIGTVMWFWKVSPALGSAVIKTLNALGKVKL